MPEPCPACGKDMKVDDGDYVCDCDGMYCAGTVEILDKYDYFYLQSRDVCPNCLGKLMLHLRWQETWGVRTCKKCEFGAIYVEKNMKERISSLEKEVEVLKKTVADFGDFKEFQDSVREWCKDSQFGTTKIETSQQ